MSNRAYSGRSLLLSLAVCFTVILLLMFALVRIAPVLADSPDANPLPPLSSAESPSDSTETSVESIVTDV